MHIHVLSVFILLGFFITVGTVQAYDNNTLAVMICPGDTVFIGESGLNISPAIGLENKIAYFFEGSNIHTDVPETLITLTKKEIANFYFNQERFGDYIGSWYAYNETDSANTELAFHVEQPLLSINIYKENDTSPIGDYKVIADETLVLRIDSPFYTLFERASTDANKPYGVFDFFATNTSGAVNYTNLSVPGIYYGLAYSQAFEAADEHLDNITVSLSDSMPGVNIHAVSPNNATLSSLIVVPDKFNPDYNVADLQNWHPDRTDYMINYDHPVWSAGRVVDNGNVIGHKILTGEYRFYADINVNGIKDNLGDIEGETVSFVETVNVEKEDITIKADQQVLVRNNDFSVTIDGTPKGLYAVWITGVSGYDYKKVPAFMGDQSDVTAMTYAQAANTTYMSKDIASDLPRDVYEAGDDGHDYTGNYAVVAKTGEDGTINIGLMTDENTKETIFTVRAQRIPNLRNPYSKYDPSGYKLDDQLYDYVKVTVEKGAVVISAKGDGSYYLGDDITISGTNTDSDYVYLFITGPNLPVAGGKLDNPKVSPQSESDSLRITVNTDDTWKYLWETSLGSTLDAGTYTIYATSGFALKSGTENTLSDVEYDSISILLKKPFVTATTSAATVAKGDKLFISGKAEGMPSKGVAIWILGKNYWNGEKDDIGSSAMVTEGVNTEGEFQYEISSAVTRDLASGQYFVVVQHPMYNEEFDVKAEVNGDKSAVEVITNPYGAKDANGIAFIIAGAGKLQGPDAANALIASINSANIDDTYTKLTFIVEEPWIRINPIGDHYVGDKFQITGTTNLAVVDGLIAEISSLSFKPTDKTQSGEFTGISSMIVINEGSDYNEWALDVDASTFKPDEYMFTVESVDADIKETTTFTVLEGTPVTSPAASQVNEPAKDSADETSDESADESAEDLESDSESDSVSETQSASPKSTTAPTPAATTAPGFGALVALLGIGAAGAGAFVIGKQIR